jgi:hypothetical protein
MSRHQAKSVEENGAIKLEAEEDIQMMGFKMKRQSRK